MGKFAADLELCCRELTSGYPVNIPVYIRGHPPISHQIGTHSRASITPSIAGGNTEEPIPVAVKRLSRARIPSISHNGNLTGVDTDSHHELFRSPYKTFHLVRDTDYFRPKLLIDSNNTENESIDQINVLYMKGIDILIYKFIFVSL